MTTKTTGWAPAGPTPKRWARTVKVLKGIFFVWLALQGIKLVFILAAMATA